MVLNWFHGKTSVLSAVHQIPHAKNWQECVLHALGRLMILQPSPSQCIFPQMQNKNLVTTMNEQYKLAYSYFKQKNGNEPVGGLLANLIPFEKPYEMTHGLLTHGNRSGAISLCASHPLVDKDAAKRRFGLANPNRDTWESYAAINMASDLVVARRLSGYEDVRKGGIAPVLAYCITVGSERIKFELFSMKLMEQNPANSDIHITITLIQIYYFRKILELAEGNHEATELTNRIIQAARYCSTTKETLLRWSDDISSRFQTDNFGPSVISNQIDRIITNDPTSAACECYRCSEFSSKLDTVIVNGANTAHNITVIAAVVERISNNGTVMSNSTSTVPTAESITNKSAVQKRRRQLSMNEFIAVTDAGSNNNLVPNSQKNLILSQMTINSLFYQWYADSLYDYVPINQGCRDDIIKCAKLIAYCKRFLPENSSIPIRPSLDQVEELQSWRQLMRALSNVVETNIINFINNHSPSVRRTRDAKVESTYKRLQKIKLTDFPTPSSVLDNTIGTGLVGRKNFYYSDISAFSRKGNSNT